MDPLPPDAEMTADGGGTAPTDQPTQFTEAERTTIQALYRRARDHADDELGPKLEKAWRSYDGKVAQAPAFQITNQDGSIVYHGSAAVVREVYDKIRAMLPELARIFLSSDEMVAFDPTGPEDEDLAKQATDYANYVMVRQNNGEELLLDAFLDWAIKFAAAKVYWSVEEKQEESGFCGLSQQALDMLLMRAAMPQDAPMPEGMADALGKAGLGSDVEIVGVEAEPESITVEMQQPMQDGSVATVPQQMVTFRGKVRKNTRRGRIAIELIPQDEVIIDPDAQKESEAALIGSDSYKRVSDVVALGIPYDVVLEHASNSVIRADNDAVTKARRGRQNDLTSTSDLPDDSLKYVRVVEALVRLDRDQDGIAERYRAFMLGDGPELIALYPGDDCYYVLASPIRRPHEPIGDGVAESLIDIQEQITGCLRAWYNSMNRANHLREIVPSDDTEAMADMESPFTNVIRAKNPERISVHAIPFVGDRNIPLIQYLETRSSGRTGISMAGQGLDPDVLKGQTVDAAKAVVTAPQVQLEFLAREFAAGFVRPTFLAILRLSKAYQDKATTIRLRNKWVEVDPSQWSADMDCSVRVGLGGGTKGEKIATLRAIMADQLALIQMGSPLASWEEYYNAEAQFCELAGYKQPGRFFKEPTPESMQAAAQQAEAQQQKAAQQAIQLEAAKAAATAAEKAKGDLEKAKLDVAAADRKAQLDAELAREAAVMQMTVQREKIAADRETAMAKLALERELKMAELAAEERIEEKKMRNHSPGGNGNLREVVQ